MRHSWAVYLLAGAVAAFAGCAVGPNYHTPGPENVPGSFNPGPGAPGAATSAKPAKSEDWWTALSDPELDSLVARATQANLDLGIALARLNEARSFRYVVAADRWPGLGFSGAAGQSAGNDATRGRMAPALNAATDTNKVKEIREAGGFDTSWELDLFGHVSRAVEAATADAQAAAEDRNQVLITVAADVVRAYAQLRGAQRRLEIAQQNVDAQQRVLDLIRRRRALQLTNELDVALAEREVETARAEVAPLAADIAVSERQIAVLLGGDPQALYAELQKSAALPQPPMSVALDQPADLLVHRPDIREAERKLAAETARIGVAVAAMFPQITLSGALGVQGQTLPGQTPYDYRFIYSYGPGVRWPILDFGRLEAAAQTQDWRTREALLTYRRTIEDAVKEVDDSLGQFAAEQDRLHQLTAAVAASDRAVRLATARYDRGLTDFLNVLDAQRQLYALEDEAATSQETEVIYWAALNKALGRGWEAIAPLDKPKFAPPGISPPIELITSRAGTAPSVAQ